MRWLIILLMVGCGANNSYMLPVVEIRCPLPATKADCQEAARAQCQGASYVVVMSRRDGDDRVLWVSCERAD